MLRPYNYGKLDLLRVHSSYQNVVWLPGALLAYANVSGWQNYSEPPPKRRTTMPAEIQ
jgi:hypothetical protein